MGSQGKIAAVRGAQCREGEKYARGEFRNPVRVLTTTVRTDRHDAPLLPVRTSRPISKALLAKAVLVARDCRIKTPVKMGDVLVKNVLKTGADLVATSDWE